MEDLDEAYDYSYDNWNSWAHRNLKALLIQAQGYGLIHQQCTYHNNYDYTADVFVLKFPDCSTVEFNSDQAECFLRGLIHSYENKV